jgi:hypothetical protein
VDERNRSPTPPTLPTGTTETEERTFDVLSKPDIFRSYRQARRSSGDTVYIHIDCISYLFAHF